MLKWPPRSWHLLLLDQIIYVTRKLCRDCSKPLYDLRAVFEYQLASRPSTYSKVKIEYSMIENSAVGKLGKDNVIRKIQT